MEVGPRAGAEAGVRVGVRTGAGSGPEAGVGPGAGGRVRVFTAVLLSTLSVSLSCYSNTP